MNFFSKLLKAKKAWPYYFLLLWEILGNPEQAFNSVARQQTQGEARIKKKKDDLSNFDSKNKKCPPRHTKQHLPDMKYHRTTNIIL